MMTRLWDRNFKDLIRLEVPPLGGALAIAELFFKFHSFLLEAVAFLVLWAIMYRIYIWAIGEKQAVKTC